MRIATTTKQLFLPSSSQSCFETWTAKYTSTRQMKATPAACTCHCQPSRRSFRTDGVLWPPPSPHDAPANHAANDATPGKKWSFSWDHKEYTHTRCLVSRIRYHPNAVAHLASARTPSGKSECHHTPDSPIHSFETCIPAWIACSQPGEWHHPRAHLLLPTSKRGPVPVTETSQTSTEAPAALKVSHLLGMSNGSGISKT